jgi:methylamine utilization protein MauE
MSGRRIATVLLLALAAAGVVILAADPWQASLLLARGALAGVFLLAAVTKLSDRLAFSETIADFGVPGSWARPLAVALPVAELGVALLLLIPATAPGGALAAIALLLLLSLAAGIALSQGRTEDCHCFGQIRPSPLGATTLIRNALLTLLAGAVAVAGPGEAAVGNPLEAVGLAGVALLVAGAMRGYRGGDEAGPGTVEGEEPGTLTRRRVIRVAGAAALGGTLASGFVPSTALARCACSDCKCLKYDKDLNCIYEKCDTCSCAAFAGGGLVRTASGSAHVAAFGTRQEGRPRDTVFGALTWFDPGWQEGGLRLQSTRITSFRRRGPVRELRGRVSANGRGGHRFVLRVGDTRGPGSGADTFSLTVSGVAAGGAGAGEGEYSASGRLAEGDFTDNVQASGAFRRGEFRRRRGRRSSVGSGS